MARTFQLLRPWIVGTIAGLGLLVAGCRSVRPLTTSGLNALWLPTVTFDYSFGG